MAALAAGGGKDARRRFFTAFMRSRLIVPSPGLAASGLPMNAGPRPVGDVRINLVGIEAPDGGNGLVVFTSEQALRRWRPVGCPYVEVAGAEAVKMAMRPELGSIVVNPSGPARVHVARAELVALAEARRR